PGLQVEHHEVGAVRPGIGAGGNVRHAARLVGRDADDPLVRHRDGIDARLAGLRVVDHRVTAGVVGPLLALAGIALLGPEVDLAAGANVVAGVDLPLGGEAGGVGADLLVG